MSVDENDRPESTTPSGRPRPTRNGYVASGFVLAVFSLLAMFLAQPVWFLCFPGIGLSLGGLLQVQKTDEKNGRGLAIAGLVLNLIAVSLVLWFFLGPRAVGVPTAD